MHHLTVIVNNNYNNDIYAPVCKESCKLTNLSMRSRTNDSKDSKGKLINSLFGSYCIGLAYGSVT